MSSDGRFRVCFVCSGNICRSPMAEFVLRRLVADAGLGDAIEVDSAGTGDWHVGEQADGRALSVLTRNGYDGSSHRARQFDPHWFARRDLVIALDRGHERTLRSWASNEFERDRIHLLRSFEPAVRGRTPSEPNVAELDVADPYYDGLAAFTAVLRQIEEASAGLLDHVRGELHGRPVRAG